MAANGFTDPLAPFGESGLSNLATYFTGSDLSQSRQFLSVDSSRTLSLRRRTEFSGVNALLEGSSDLQNWMPISSPLSDPVDNEDGTERVQIVIDNPGMFYIRLRVTME